MADMRAPALTQALPHAPRDATDARSVETWAKGVNASLEKMRLELAASVQSTQSKVQEVEAATGVQRATLTFGPAAGRPTAASMVSLYAETDGEHRLWLFTGTQWVLMAARLAWTAS